MAIAPHHIPAPYTAVVMPNTFFERRRAYFPVTGISRPVPGPVALDDFVGRASGDLIGFDRDAIGLRSRYCAIGGGVFNTKPIY